MIQRQNPVRQNGRSLRRRNPRSQARLSPWLRSRSRQKPARREAQTNLNEYNAKPGGFNGKPIASVKTAFSRAVKLAGLSSDRGKIIPHTLRHTAATWLMQRGVPVWEAAGYLGMSVETLERVYGHHSPDHLKVAADAITGKSKPRVSVVVSVVGENGARAKNQKSHCERPET